MSKRQKILGLRPERWGLVLVIAAALLPYVAVLEAPFVFDDTKLVKENELLRLEGEEASRRLLEIFDVTSRRWEEDDVRVNYRPLRFLSYYVDYRLSRWLLGEFPPDDPPTLFFHLQNIFWHAVNALLVFVIGRRLLGCVAGGFIVALLFALHPLQTEAVTYVSGRRDVLSTFLLLAAFSLYLLLPLRDSRGKRALLLALVVVGVPLLFVCGLLTKEMVITLPPLLLLVDLLQPSRLQALRRSPGLVVWITLHLTLWAVVGLFVVFVTFSNAGLVADVGDRDLTATILTAGRYVARYLGLVLFPVSQSVDYSFDAIPRSHGLLDPGTSLPSLVLVLALLGGAAWTLYRRRGIVTFGILWFLGTLVPVLQFVPIAEQFAERFAYLPSIGILLVVAVLLLRLVRFEAVLGWGSVGVLALVLLVSAFARNADWKSPLALWSAAVMEQPRCARAQLAYAEALKDAGRLREAKDATTRALRIWSTHPSLSPADRGRALVARTLRGGICAVLGQEEEAYLEEAIADLVQVLASRDTDGTLIENSPRHAVIHLDLAGCYLRLAQLEKAGAERRQNLLAQAKQQYRRLVEIGSPPELVTQGYYMQSRIQLLEGNVDAALDLVRKAAQSLPPGDSRRILYRLEVAGDLVKGRRGLDKAWGILQDVLGDRPTGPERAGALLRQAEILDVKGEVHGALQKLEEARAADPQSIPVLETLADFKTRLKDYAGAREVYRHILEQDPANARARNGLLRLELREKMAAGDNGASLKTDKLLAGLLAKGRQHVDQGQLSAALNVYGQLVEAAVAAKNRRMVATACVQLGSVHDKLGQYRKAAEALNRALQAQPEMPEALMAIGHLYLRRLHRHERALAYYLRYLEALPDGQEAEPGVHYNVALLLKEKEPEKALEHFLKAKELGVAQTLGKAAPRLDRELGYLFAQLERFAEALEAFNRYLDEAEASDPRRQEVTEFVSEKVIPRLLPQRSSPSER